ncbi:prostaglandin D2 receptor-like [Aphis craccivora]|uniref:Prostaglandin D2 receptor-like n=1 Tax=Aphis craccivora TaxID=307492 RepID=A0A6G0YL20_APHCR|nr:prostaglandin D2 receptor-like [Aphis craccivora]
MKVIYTKLVHKIEEKTNRRKSRTRRKGYSMELSTANVTTLPSPASTVIPISTLSVNETLFYIGLAVIGIFGNLLELFILYRTRSSSNQKHVFMLRCMATNDLIVVVALLVQVCVNFKRPDYMRNRLWSCRLRVVWRFFTLYSGCLAMVMAIERWVALTKPNSPWTTTTLIEGKIEGKPGRGRPRIPFLKQNISLRQLKLMVVILWLGEFCLVCAPIFGFGLYWDEKLSLCVRYRYAKKPLDVLYAYLYFCHGVFLCSTIVYTNLAVMKALCMKDSLQNKHNGTMRRSNRESSLTFNTITNEERAFGWLMFLLCVAFVTCWVPQMISIPLTRFVEDESRILPFTIAGDILLAIHFPLDPFLYVLQQWTLVKSVCFSELRPKNKENANDDRSSMRITTDEVFSQQQF